ncbi:hypothetical protein ACEQUB_02749 [Ralstonia syzygii]
MAGAAAGPLRDRSADARRRADVLYLLHLYALHLAYLLALHVFGANHGDRFGFDAVWQLWAVWLPTVALLYGPTRRFAALRRTGRHPWMRYL